MADEYPVTRTSERPIERPPRPRQTPEFPENPDAARAEIEATRARMSETIDEIEDVLLRKKKKIREQLDVLAPVREEPLKTLGMIFGAALALGLLTGGGGRKDSSARDEDDHEEVLLRARIVEEEDDDEEAEAEAALAWERAEAWEDRAHRLLRIAKAQEAELEIHRARRDTLRRSLRGGRFEREDEYDDDFEDDGGEPNLFDRLRESAADRLSGLVGEVSQRMMRGS